jgi:hypothetical protein
MRRQVLIFLHLLVLSGWPAWAGTVTYFDRAAFMDASKTVPGLEQSISFARFIPYGDMLEFGRSVSISNVTSTGSYLVAIRRYPYAETSPVGLLNYDAAVPISLHFETGTRAFGADFSSQVFPQFTSFTATVSLDNGESFSFTAPADPEFRFFGFITDHPILNLTFSDGGIIRVGPFALFHEELIKDIFMVAEIPEPGSLALIGLGASSIALRQFWRRKELL